MFFSSAGDVALRLPVLQTLQLHSATSNRSTFCYEYTHKRNASLTFWYEGPDWLRYGADHADEIPYVLGYPFLLSKYLSY